MANFSATVSSKCSDRGDRHTVRLTSDSWEAWATARNLGEQLAFAGMKDVKVDYFAGGQWVAWSRAHRSMDAITRCNQELLVLPFS